MSYLGILIDKNLSWKYDIDNGHIEVRRIVGLIAKLWHYEAKHILLSIYRALIARYLTYEQFAWGQAFKSYLDNLLKMQKLALAMSMQFHYILALIFYR